MFLKPTGCPGAGRCGGIEDVICAIGGGTSTMISGTSSMVTPSGGLFLFKEAMNIAERISRGIPTSIGWLNPWGHSYIT